MLIDCHFSGLNVLIASVISLKIGLLTWTSLLEVDSCIYKADYKDYFTITKSIIPTASINTGNDCYNLRYFRNVSYISSFVLGPDDILNAHAKEETLNAQNIENCSLHTSNL